MRRSPKLLAKAQSLPTLKDARPDIHPCPLPGGFNDILARSRRLSDAIREPNGELGSQLLLEKLRGGRPATPQAAKPLYSYTLALGDAMYGFKIGDRVCILGRAGMIDASDAGTVIAAGRVAGLLVVELDSMPGCMQDAKADLLHHMTAKEEEELEIRTIQSLYKKQVREAKRLSRGAKEHRRMSPSWMDSDIPSNRLDVFVACPPSWVV